MINLRQFKKSEQKRVITPTILQLEAVECGAAALCIILEYYGRIVPLTELRQVCGVSRDGSKAINIIKAARTYGLEADGFKSSLEELKNFNPPYIVFWHFNHFLVVEGIVNDQVYLSDPALGRRKVSWEEFDDGYTGVVITFSPGPNFEKGGEKKSIIISLHQRLQGSYDALFACLLTGLLLVIPRLAIPVFTGQFLDEVLMGSQPNWLLPILWGIGLGGFFTVAIKTTQLRYLRRLQIKLGIEMSSRFLWRLLRLPTDFYAQRFAGEISNRLNYNDTVAQTLSGQLAQTLIDGLTMVIFGLVLLTYDFPLTIIITLLAAINFFVLQRVSRRRIDANMTLIQDYGKVAGVTISGLQNIETIKASGLESDFFSRWAGYYTKASNNMQELGSQNQILSLLPPFLSQIANLAILIIGGLGVIYGKLSLGSFIAYQQLANQFLQPVNSLVGLGQTLQELVGNLNRLDDVLANSPDPELEITEEIPLTSMESSGFRLQGYLEIRNLTFGYSKVDPPLITNFSLNLKPGNRVALVGGSGSGKTTIARLITGLYQPWSGEILFDGKPRQAIPRLVLANSLAMVDQDIVLFGDTVRNNLTLWDKTLSDQDLILACQDAVIHDTILALPQSYNSPLLEQAVNLSGGQRQRLEIARALITNPTIVVMDEATSALDTQTEEIITRNLLHRGCTCVIVAHRLSTIRDCDEIIVLQRGKITERGTHQQLWEKQGYYAELLRSESPE